MHALLLAFCSEQTRWDWDLNRSQTVLLAPSGRCAGCDWQGSNPFP